jgi:hypothetical protein
MRVPPYALLAIGIVAEVIATSALRASEGFFRLLPAVIVVLGYGVAFYGLSLTLRSIPVGIVYTIWSGCRHRPDQSGRGRAVPAGARFAGHHRVTLFITRWMAGQTHLPAPAYTQWRMV